MILVKALTKPSTYFLFRENGEEVELTIKDGILERSYPLVTPKEKEYIIKNYSKNEYSSTK